MTTQMKQRRDTPSNWATKNPVLADGEIGIDKTAKAFKVGDGSTRWADLRYSYILGSLLTQKGDLPIGAGPKSPSVLLRGTTGQMLVVLSDGTLAWRTVSDPSTFETTTHAAATYETQTDAATVHDTKISSNDMSSTYQKQSACASVHSTLETFTHAAATFQTISAADAAYEKKWQTVVKQATNNRSATTTLANDTELQFQCVASGVYVFEVFLSYIATVSGQMKLTVACPTAAVSSWSMHAPTTALASGAANGPSLWASNGGSPNAAAVGVGGAGATSPLFITMRGVVKTGVNAGGVALQFAQLTSVADTGYSVLPGSYLRAFRVS